MTESELDRPLRLLLVDDDEDDFILTSRLLDGVKGGCFRLDWAASYEQGRERVLAERPDLVFVDHNLGARTGLELLRELRTLGADEPVIMLTGDRDREVDLEAMRAGASDYLVKGAITPDLLERSVRYALERARSARELRRSEGEFRALVEHSPDIIARFDREGRHLYVNPAVELLTSRLQEEFIGRTNRELGMPPSLCALLEKATERAFTTGRTESVEFEYAGVGESRYFLATLAPEISTAGVVETVLAIARDVTAVRKAVRETEQLRERLEQILLSAGDGIFGMDREGKTTFVNPAAARLLGLTPGDLVGRPQHDVIHHSHRDGRPYSREECPIHSSLRSGAIHRSATDVFWRADGTCFPVEYTSTPIREDGEIGGAVVTFQDITERRRQEEALRSSEERLRGILDTAVEAITIVDVEGRISYANPAAERVLGVAPAAVTERSFDDTGWRITAVDGSPFPEEELPFARVMATGESVYAVDHAIEHPDGRRVILSVNAAPLRDEAGKVTAVVAACRDVTDRVEAAARLAAAEAHYRRLVEHSPMGIYALRGDGSFAEVNAAAAEIVGRPAAELVGRPFDDLVAPADRERALDVFRRRLGGQQPVEDPELWFVRPDGEQRLVRIRAVPVVEGGQIVGTHGVAQDITEERRRDEQVRLLAAALEQLEEAVSIADSDGRLVYTNAAHARMLGYDPSETGQYRLGDFTTGRSPVNQMENVLASLHRQGSWAGRLEKRGKHGRTIPVAVIMGALRIGGRDLTLTISRDITEELARERHVLRAERLASVGTLLSGVAHELNNPLHAISNFTQLMLLDSRTPEDQEALEIMKRETERAAKVVSDLRLIARQTQEDATEKEAVDFNDVVRHVLKLRRYTHGTHNLEVASQLDDTLPAVVGNRSELEQVLLNLVINAEQALATRAADRRLSIQTTATYKSVVLRVADNGPGIEPSEANRIFDPFFTTKAPGEGTGLGLSLVHRIVADHAGTVSVSSVPGAGAEFVVEIPRAGVSPPPVCEKPLPPPSRPLRILLVDDEPALRASIGRFLRRRGHQVDEARDGLHALEAVEGEDECAYDVILSDLRMPGLGGEQLLAALSAREDGSERRVVIMTGDAASPEAARILERLRLPTLVKPVRLDVLAETVEIHASGGLEPRRE